jgi:PTS system nitrogen regulatory IIA component
MEAFMKIGRLLSEDDIALDLVTKGKRSALSKIAARIAKRLSTDERTVLGGLLARERLHPTGVGGGVAIPHAPLDGLSGPAASLTRLAHPIDFGAPDDDRVDLIFTLLWPRDDVDNFLPALAGACRLFRSSALREMIRQAQSAAEILAIIRSVPHRLSPTGVPPQPAIADRTANGHAWAESSNGKPA